MSTTNTQLVALVRAKDETAELKLDVNLGTTLGELLRYWKWRETSDQPAEGFHINLSLVQNAIVANNAPAAPVVGEEEVETVEEAPPAKKARTSKATPKPRASSSRKAASPAISPIRRTPRRAVAAEEHVPQGEPVSISSLLASFAASSSKSRTDEVPRPKGQGASTVNKGAKSKFLPAFVKVEGWGSGTVDPGAKGFHVKFVLADKSLYYYIQPSARSFDLCRAACSVLDVDYEGVRFMDSDTWNVLLIRDDSGDYNTVEAWGLEEGSVIEVMLCQCGC